jgi:general nucleoside transport system ATP-binding protein
MTASPLLELIGITKRFPGVTANDSVSLAVSHREIHALLGENGAGKSTLVKMIYGVMQPDEGVMRFDGAVYAPERPSVARAHHVGMVFQHFSLFDGLNVAENIALGLSGAMPRKKLRQRVIDVSADYGLRLDPDRLVGELSVGERQRVEIVRCLLQEPKLLIMDEPTSVLTPQEVELLFAVLRRLAAEGCSILYISHKLEEVRGLCSRATILRGGKVVASCDPRQESAGRLAELMIGRPLAPPARGEARPGPVRLEVNGLTLPGGAPFGVDLKDVSLKVRGGEILGIAGVAGNGQTELMEALTGERVLATSDPIRIDEHPVGTSGPSVRRGFGMCFVPEERLGQGAVPDMPLWENTLLTAGRRMSLRSRLGLINAGRAKTFAEKIIAEYGVRTPGSDHAARSLSGGNLQKFIAGREILQAPSVLIAAQPTWGVDAGAAASIHSLLLGLARAGTAIVVISQDLDELMAIATRIAVIAGGRLTEARPVETLTPEAIGLSMGGRHPEALAHA